MIWILIKMLFNKTGFKKALRNLSKQQVTEYKQKALSEENYELAAYLEYYLEFKFKTQKTTV